MKYIIAFALFLFSCNIFSQDITYSSTFPDGSRILDGGIIGKVAGNYLICTIENGKVLLNTYDNKMSLKNKQQLYFIPDSLLDIKFVVYPGFFNMVYQTIENGKYFCKAIQLNPDGSVKKEIKIDSGAYNRGNYSISVSENKDHILLSRNLYGLKANALERDELVLTENLDLEKTDHYFIPFISQNSISNDAIDNNGNIIYLTWEVLYKKNRTNLTFYKSPAHEPELVIKDAIINKYALQEPLIRINNEKNVYYFISLYQTIKIGNTDGLIAMILKNDLSDHTKPQQFRFTDSVKRIADKNLPVSKSLNHYFLDDLILKKDGGFVLIARAQGRVSSSTGFPRYYSPSYPSYSYFDYQGNIQNVHFPTGYNPAFNPSLIITYGNEFPNVQSTYLSYTSSKTNMMTFSFNNNNMLVNINSLNRFLPKASFADYNMMVLDSQVLFIYNNTKRNSNLLSNLSLFADGSTLLNPSFKNADESLTFFPGYGNQVDEKTFILPCVKNKRFAFAKISFD